VARKIFVAATRENQGKTTFSAGLLGCLEEKSLKVGYIKPLGQHHIHVGEYAVDEDAYLMYNIFKWSFPLHYTSPVVFEKDSTRAYIDNPEAPDFEKRILESLDVVSRDKDFVVIEGTGHAGVGSLIELCNARVSKLVGAKVVLVTEGGIGKPFDEVMLNHAIFEKEGAELLGVIINKVFPDKLEMVKSYLTRAFSRKGIALLGILPLARRLVGPSVRQVCNGLNAKLLYGEEFLDNHIQDIVVGTMTAHHALKSLHQESLLITEGDREDLIFASMACGGMGNPDRCSIAAVLLAGGLEPHPRIGQALAHCRFPVLLVDDDSYEAATKVYALMFSPDPSDRKKIQLSKELVKERVDVDYIIENA